ncbi:MAG: hypothetical protein ACM3WV_10325 [Bacillota bacterium]
MKNKAAIVLLLILVLAFPAFAFTRSGDGELDVALSILNTSGRSDYGTFKSEMVLSYNITAGKIDFFYLKMGVQPADVFMICVLATLAGVSIDRVYALYRVNKPQGWGYIAKQLGIKPGSKAFHSLKGKARNHTDHIKNKGKGKKKK